MPLPPRMSAQAVTTKCAEILAITKATKRPFVVLVLFVVSAFFVVLRDPVALTAQAGLSDADLARASGGRTVRLGSLQTGRYSAIPLEVYVARVLAGEGEPDAADAARQALAIAIRTFALANAGRHRSAGFDLCDTTHCQVPRTASDGARAAALATAGQVLTYNGAPAEVFYSASCGGRSETASALWPRANFPYLRSVEDDVHDEDRPWTLELTRDEARRALVRAGFEGDELRELRVDARTESGRVGRLTLTGMRPATISGDAFRAAVGQRELRSTAFTVTRDGEVLRFTGRGYGHGVGMCVVGSGRRARRGEDARTILQWYYPGLQLVTLN
jgi:stage II sporulation protein D